MSFLDRTNWDKIWTSKAGDGQFLNSKLFCNAGTPTKPFEAQCKWGSQPFPIAPYSQGFVSMQPYSPAMANAGSGSLWSFDESPKGAGAMFNSVQDQTNKKNLRLGFDWSVSNRYFYLPYITTQPTNITKWDTNNVSTGQGTIGIVKQEDADSTVTGGLCYSPTISNVRSQPIYKGNLAIGGETPVGTNWPTDAKNDECQWLNFENVYNCCSGLTKDQNCGSSYTPETEGAVCPDLMLKLCTNNWKTQDCQDYLQKATIDAKNVGVTAVVNYITSRSPQDYVSAKNGINIGINTRHREDSNNPFFTSVLPTICNSSEGLCDVALDKFCSTFTKADMQKDQTLAKLCGCHLNNGSPPPQACNTFGAKKCINLTNKFVAPTQYVIPGITLRCDPTCRNTETIQPAGSACTSTECLISNINVSSVNSSGPTYISQQCQGSDSECYINEVTIEKIDSNGKIELKQNCGSCFSYKDGNPQSATVIDCSTLKPMSLVGGLPRSDVNTAIIVFIASILFIFILIFIYVLEVD